VGNNLCCKVALQAALNTQALFDAHHQVVDILLGYPNAVFHILRVNLRHWEIKPFREALRYSFSIGLNKEVQIEFANKVLPIRQRSTCRYSKKAFAGVPSVSENPKV